MTTEIEKTKRALYDCLDRIRRAGKHRVLTAEFEERLEEHLEVLRQHENNLSRNCLAHLETAGQMRQERDQIQQRLHAIDHAYNEQQILVSQQAFEIEKLKFTARAAGEELIRVQEIARKHLDDATTTRKQLSDAMVLVRRQRAAIGHLYMLNGMDKNQTTKSAQVCNQCLNSGKVWAGLGVVYCTCPYGGVLRESNHK